MRKHEPWTSRRARIIRRPTVQDELCGKQNLTLGPHRCSHASRVDENPARPRPCWRDNRQAVVDSTLPLRGTRPHSNCQSVGTKGASQGIPGCELGVRATRTLVAGSPRIAITTKSGTTIFPKRKMVSGTGRAGPRRSPGERKGAGPALRAKPSKGVEANWRCAVRAKGGIAPAAIKIRICPGASFPAHWRGNWRR